VSPIGITLALVAAFAGFFALAWRKLSIVARLARSALGPARASASGTSGATVPAVAHDPWRPAAGTDARRTVSRLPRAARAQSAADRDRLRRVVRLSGVAGGLFATFKDAVEVVVLLAVGYGFWRRFVEKPRRLEPNREAILILALIAAIMVTDFAFDGFRFAKLAAVDAGIAHEAAFSPAGAWWGWVSALPSAAIDAGYHAFYWLQMLTVLTFLVLLPHRRALPHRHRAARRSSSRGGEPGRRVPAVDLERVMNAADGEEVAVGARTAPRLFRGRTGSTPSPCTECGVAKDACPTFLTGKPLAQKWVHDSIKHHLLEQRDAILATPTADATGRTARRSCPA